jgi:hypothetical protein
MMYIIFVESVIEETRNSVRNTKKTKECSLTKILGFCERNFYYEGVQPQNVTGSLKHVQKV